MTKIWEGAKTKNADLDKKVGPHFTLSGFRAALFLIKFYGRYSRAGGAKIFCPLIDKLHDVEAKNTSFPSKKRTFSKAGGCERTLSTPPRYALACQLLVATDIRNNENLTIRHKCLQIKDRKVQRSGL